MKKLMALVLVLVMVMSVNSFAAEGDIVDIASGNADFSILVQALVEADLVGALQGDGPFTVFAPTDAAFVSLLEALDITAGDLLGHPQLSEVLLYHVVAGKVMSTDLVNGMMAETLLGESISVDLTDGVKINDASVVAADIEATNGVIHVIDSVLVPASFVLSAEEPEAEPVAEVPGTVVDIALSNPDFSILVAALQQADLVGALQGDGPFTVFAPTNAAFEALLDALDISAADLLAQPDLAKVLLYHVVSGQVMAGDLSDGLEAATLNGQTVTFDLSYGVMVSGSTVVLADLQAGNGVVHVIDTVLVPDDFTYQAVETMEETMPQTGVTDLTPFLAIGMMVLALAGGILIKKRLYQ